LPFLIDFTEQRLIRGDPDLPLHHEGTIPDARGGQTRGSPTPTDDFGTAAHSGANV
jgi:hypothetical protein